MATEIELKLLLVDEAAHDVVRSALDRIDPHATTLDQVNYYLDTPRADLHAQGAMVRRRVQSGQTVLTVKTRPVMSGGVVQVGEWEKVLTGPDIDAWLVAAPARVQIAQLQATEWLSEPGVLTSPLPPETWLHVVGAMANTRRVYRFDRAQFGLGTGEIKVELDHARYGVGGQDSHRYEVEVEDADAHNLRPALEKWLDSLGVVHWPADETKFAQLLRLLRDH